MREGMFVKVEAVHPGLHPTMPIVEVLTADGTIAQFEVSGRAIVDGRVSIGWPVGRRQDGALLVEFGTQRGRLNGGLNFGCHRVWVPRASLVRGDEMEDAGAADRGGKGGGE